MSSIIRPLEAGARGGSRGSCGTTAATAPRPSLMSADVWSFAAIYSAQPAHQPVGPDPLLPGCLVPRIVTALFYARHVASGAARRPAAEAMATPELAWPFYGCSWPVSVSRCCRSSTSRLTARAAPTFCLPARGGASDGRRALSCDTLLPGVVAGWCLSTFWAWARAGDVPPAPTLGWLVEGAAQWPLPVLLIVLGIGIYAVAMALASIVLRSRPTFADGRRSSSRAGAVVSSPAAAAHGLRVTRAAPGRVLPRRRYTVLAAIPATSRSCSVPPRCSWPPRASDGRQAGTRRGSPSRTRTANGSVATVAGSSSPPSPGPG